MSKQSILKICFRPKVILKIVSDELLTYRYLVEIVISQLEVTTSQRQYLEICDDDGNVFDNVSFNCYLQLFPQSKRIFYIKLNDNFINDNQIKNAKLKPHNKKCEDASLLAEKAREREIMEFDVVKRKSKETLDHENKKRKLNSGAKYVEQTPLRRENCFIGTYPTSKK